MACVRLIGRCGALGAFFPSAPARLSVPEQLGSPPAARSVAGAGTRGRGLSHRPARLRAIPSRADEAPAEVPGVRT
jgi:hypothetical protein